MEMILSGGGPKMCRRYVTVTATGLHRADPETDDVGMSRRGWALLTVVGVTAVAVGVLMLWAGLDAADKIGSVVGALCGVIGQPGLTADPRFATLAVRQQNIEALTAIIADWTRSQDKHAVAARLQAAGVPAAPVQTPQDLARSEYLAHRGFFTVLEHADAGRHPHPGLPIHLDATPGSQRRAAPRFGADNHRVLRDILGLTPEEVAAAEASGAMATEPRPGA